MLKTSRFPLIRTKFFLIKIDITRPKFSNLLDVFFFVFAVRLIRRLYLRQFVTAIGHRAFFKATSLETVIFAEGSKLESIEEYTFYLNTVLTSITIPASVKSIGTSAFMFAPSM